MSITQSVKDRNLVAGIWSDIGWVDPYFERWMDVKLKNVDMPIHYQIILQQPVSIIYSLSHALYRSLEDLHIETDYFTTKLLENSPSV